MTGILLGGTMLLTKRPITLKWKAMTLGFSDRFVEYFDC